MNFSVKEWQFRKNKIFNPKELDLIKFTIKLSDKVPIYLNID